MLVAITFCVVQKSTSDLGASSIFVGRGSNQFVADTLVLAIDHVSQARQLSDIEVRGQEWANRYYTIRTPLTAGSRVMYRYTMIGYSYGVAKPLDCVWVGYLYNRKLDAPIKTFTNCKYYTGAKATTYMEDGFLVLKLGPISRYCNAFEVHYQGHFANATMGLHLDQYYVTATPN